ncbi:MAG: hypothetical protein ACREJO_00275 [Phycisphaerales bacterium]
MPQSGGKKVWLIASIAAAVIALGAGLFFVLKPGAALGYSQSTPDDTLRTAIAMVKNGDAEKIPTQLIHADKPELRSVLKRLSEMFASIQALAFEINRCFPDDVRKLRAQYAQELADGTAPSIMNILPPAGGPGGGGSGGFDPEQIRKRAEEEMRKRQNRGNSATPPASVNGAAPAAASASKSSGSITISASPSGVSATAKPAANGAAGTAGEPGQPKPVNPEREFQALAARLLADPFSWLTENAAKLSTEKIADDQAAVLYDGKPVPPLGLTMRQVNDKWYFVLPINSPGVSQYMPQTRHEWSIIGSLLKVLDNSLKDVANEVRSGKVQRMDKLAESVGEKAFIPGAMVAVMYGKEMDVRQRREKAVGAFKKRWNTWAKTRDSDDPVVLGKLIDSVNRLAVEELDHSVRLVVKDPQTNKLPDFPKLTDAELLQMVEGWISGKGVRTNLAGPLDAKSIDEAAAKIDAFFSGKVQRKK